MVVIETVPRACPWVARHAARPSTERRVVTYQHTHTHKHAHSGWEGCVMPPAGAWARGIDVLFEYLIQDSQSGL